MKKLFTPKTLIIAAFAVVIMAAGTAVKNGGGPPASKANAPAETNCTDAGCHSSFSLNPTPANLNNLTISIPFTGNGYIPDSTYNITLSYSQAGINRFGFQITALSKTGNNPAGTFTAGTGMLKTTGSVAGKTREYISHTTAVTGGSGSRSWTFPWKAPSTNVDSIIFYVCVNAANSDGSSSGDEIYCKSFTFGASNLLPIASASANKTTVCVGDTVEFSGSGTNGTTGYLWKFRGNPTTSTLQNPKVVYSIAGIFADTLRVVNAKGQSAPKTVTITVLAKPSAGILNISPNDTVCQGDSVTLTANFAAGLKYKWNTGKPGDTLQIVKVGTAGNYTVTTTNAGGCSTTSAPVNIVVNAKPTVTLAASKDTTCSGDSVTFTATAGLASYAFRKNGTVVQTSASNTYKTLMTNADSISVIGTNSGGCASVMVSKKVFVVQRLSAPVITCGTSTTSSVTFNWAAITGALGYEVSADSGKTWIAPSSGSSGLTHTVTGLGFNTPLQIRVRATDNAPCGISSTGMAVCTTLPCAAITYVPQLSDTLSCPGDSVLISINNISATQYSLRFNGGSFGTATQFWVTPATTTTYPFEIIDSTKLNCPPLAFNVQVKVENVPTLAIIQFNPTLPVCDGQNVTLTSTTGFDFYTILLNGGPTFHSSINGVFTNASFSDDDTIKVVAATANGCPAVSQDYIWATNPLPKVGFTANVTNKVVNFDDTTSTTNTRTWRFGEGTATSTAKTPTHTYATVGNFNVTLIVTDGNGCIDSVTKQITTANVGVKDIPGLSGLEMYPNPTQGKLVLDFVWENTSPIEIRVTNIAGQLVWNETLEVIGKVSKEINLQELPDGVYMLSLRAEGAEKTMKLIKQSK